MKRLFTCSATNSEISGIFKPNASKKGFADDACDFRPTRNGSVYPHSKSETLRCENTVALKRLKKVTKKFMICCFDGGESSVTLALARSVKTV